MMQQQQQQQGMKSTTTLDFSKLERFALMKLLKHYNVNPTVGATHQELVAMTAKAFENTIVSEHDVILKFSHNLMRPAEGSSRLKGGRYLRNHLDSEPAKIGEQVGSRLPDGWILGNVTAYEPHNGCYIIQDEDDTSRHLRLHARDVKRLEDSASHLRKGDAVLAVFADTTSFYRAIVAKNPKAPAHVNSSWEVVVRFEDDEDETGVAPPRRVPARFVLKESEVEDEDM